MSFRDGAVFHRNRKSLKDVNTKFDLTERRYGILKDAIDLAKEHSDLEDLEYVFADANCRLKVVFKDGTTNSFNDIDNLNSVINNRS